MRNVSSLETVFRDYRQKGVEFYYVYKNLAHPEVNGFVPAFTIDERLQHVARAREMLKTEIPWICDTMDNPVKQAFGGTYNGEFIIDPEGQLVRKRFWSDPAQLRRDLIDLIGPTDKITRVEDLPALFTPEPSKLASNVVPRPKLPAGLLPLKRTPSKSDVPYFAKLRIEASREFARSAKGDLFFAVYLDPIHKVHWNNRAGRVKLEIVAEGEDYLFEKTLLESPEVVVEADVDPRWMVVRGQSRSAKPFVVKLVYTVCDNQETFCKTVEQEYTVWPETDSSQGTRPGIFLNGLFAHVREFDIDGDGQITRDELPVGDVTMYLGHLDYNDNGVIESDEIDRFMAMFNQGRGVDSTDDGG